MLRAHPIVLALLTTALSQAQFSVTYGFPNVSPQSGITDPGPAPAKAGLNCGLFTAHNVSPIPSASGRFSFTNWPGGSLNGLDDPALMNGNLSGLQYYEVKLVVLPGYTLQLNSIHFDVRRSSSGIRNYSVRGDRDNFLNNLAASTGTNANLQVLPDNVFFWKYDSIGTSSDQKHSMIQLSSLYHVIKDSVCFRYYAWNAETSGGSFSIDNVSFSGLLQDSTSLFVSAPKSMSGDKNIQCAFENSRATITATGFCQITLHSADAKELFSSRFQNQITIDLKSLAQSLVLMTVRTEQGYWRKWVIPSP